MKMNIVSSLVVSVSLIGCAGSKVTSHTVTKTETTYSSAAGTPFQFNMPAGAQSTTQRAPVVKDPVVAVARPVNPGQLAKDVPMDFEPIRFETSKSNLDKASARSVASLAAYLKAHPKAKVTIEGHTDAPGTLAVNKTLGAQRANVVRQSLLKHGVPARRIATLNRGGDATERKATATIAID